MKTQYYKRKKENYFNYLDKWRTEIIEEPKLFSTTFRLNKYNRFDVGYGYHWESIYEVFYKYYEIYGSECLIDCYVLDDRNEHYIIKDMWEDRIKKVAKQMPNIDAQDFFNEDILTVFGTIYAEMKYEDVKKLLKIKPKMSDVIML